MTLRQAWARWTAPAIPAASAAGELPSVGGEEGDGVHLGHAELIRLHGAASGLGLSWQKRVLSAQAGGYLSPFRGRGIDFDHVRAYQPGDDIRAMDWRVTARTGRPHTKIFREERERPGWLVVDLGESMRFGTRVAFKSVLAARAAALLGWGLADNGDRVGAVIASGAMEAELPPSAGHTGMARLIRSLVQIHAQPPRGGGLAPALARLAQTVRPGSLIFVLSDFRDLDHDGRMRLARHSLHNDVVAIRLHDPLEAALPGTGYYRFGDGERTLGLHAGGAMVTEHARRFAAFREELTGFFRQHRIHNVELASDAPLLETLVHGLHHRRHAARDGKGGA